MVDKQIDYNALGQVIDTTWGKSSTPKSASFSVKMSLFQNNKIIVKYSAIVNFGTEVQMIETKRRYIEESLNAINETLKIVKKNYKELTDSSLTFKEVSSNDSLEIISTNFYNPKRTAYFRKQSIFEIV